MAIKFTVLRYGQDCDLGPNGEYGIVLTGTDKDYTTGFTGHCLIAHEHSKACAQAILDAEGRDALTATIEAYNAKQASKPVHTTAAMPKKSVTKDGKDEQVDDLEVV